MGQYALLGDDARSRLCAVRFLGWSLKPCGCGLWRAPPILPPNPPIFQPFGFDISPHCQFWLCDQILNAADRESIHQVVHCKAFGTFCLYFSIEFGATTDDTRVEDEKRVVENRLAAAGAVSLFNRCQLKLDAYPHPTPEQLKLVRHYGLTMEKEDWALWRFEPKIANDAWAGCTMRYLLGHTCRAKGGIRILLSWINEIHRWGLCEYALGCKEDVKQILSRSEDP